jgi:hypothetical protein
VNEFLAKLLLLGALWLTGAWLLMLGVGIVHADWIPWLPTIGFPTALLLSLLSFARSLVAMVVGYANKAGDRR